MSLKMKQIREQHGFTVASFSQALQVSDRTVRYWEKPEGVIPPIQMMKEIAQVLKVSTYEIFHAFLSNPDAVEDDTFKFNDHKSDLYNVSSPSLLFKYIHDKRLFGEGLVIFRHRVFRYKQLIMHDLQLENPIEYFFHPCDGVILNDESSNSVILSEVSIVSAKMITHDSVHTVFEIQSKAAVFPEMDDLLQREGVCYFYLDAYVTDAEQYLPYTKPVIVELKLNEKNILGQYIRLSRERKNLTQEQLAIDLNTHFGLKTKKSVLSQWENGTRNPSAYDFAILCVYLNITPEKILYAYEKGIFISSALDNNSFRYDIGMHHSFWNLKDFKSLYAFMNQYCFFNIAQFSQPILLGHHECNGTEKNILSISLEGQKIELILENDESIIINEENLVQVVPVSLNLGVYYELVIDLQKNTSNSKHTIGLVYNISAVTISDDSGKKTSK